MSFPSHLNAADGLLLATTHWPIDSASPRARILIVHGLGEHAGRYGAMAARLNAEGFEVLAYDHRGHGRSAGARGGITRSEALLSDLALVIDHARSLGPEPLILFGHSMGGLVAARMVAEGAGEGATAQPAAWWRQVDALVLSSPALAADINPLQKLLLAIGSLLPDLPAHNGLESGWISRDPAVVAAYDSDPLVHDRITPRLAKFILGGAEVVHAAAPRWPLPTLLLWAGADRCVAPRGSLALASAAPAAQIEGRAFEGCAHEVFNEPEPDRSRFYAALSGWLDARFQRASDAANRSGRALKA
jgi:alpha-beta hydrolase superfamily lysophospholipase